MQISWISNLVYTTWNVIKNNWFLYKITSTKTLGRLPDDADDLLSKGKTCLLITVSSSTLSQYPLPIFAVHFNLIV